MKQKETIMILREIEISGLYGYLDKRIKFHRDINLLVGINGSGKTSVLNLLNWMLNPATLPELCITQFRSISLKLNHKTINYELICTQKPRQLTFRILREGAKRQPFHPLEILLLAPPEKVATQPELRKRVLEQYRGLKPTEAELKSYAFLQEIPKAVILGLDRTIPRDTRDPRPSIPTSAVEQIQEIANVNYSRYQSRMNRLNNQLRNEFMLSAFNVEHFKKVRKPSRVALSQIQKWKDRFGSYLSQSQASNTAISAELRKAAKQYFGKLESILANQSTQGDLVLLASEAQKLRRLIAYLENFERGCEEAYKPITSYLSTLNSFFHDSSKRIHFKPDTYQICFQVLDKKDQPIGDPRSVELLSSGEKQLLTLFTFIKFSRGGIYVIDEPELSLHPKWQDGFLEGIKRLMPPETQLILATHSPAIVGENRKYCIPLLPYNG